MVARFALAPDLNNPCTQCDRSWRWGGPATRVARDTSHAPKADPTLAHEVTGVGGAGLMHCLHGLTIKPAMKVTGGDKPLAPQGHSNPCTNV